MAKRIYANGFELMAINREFINLIRKHENDMDVQGESRECFLNFGTANEGSGLKKYFASICNAWDELCALHSGLRESGLAWFAGAEWTEYPNNSWDVFVGKGNELD